MKPGDLAASLRSITPAALGGLSADQMIGIASTLATIAPKILDVLDGVDDVLNGASDGDLAAAITRAAARNRSAEARAALEAELASVT